MKTSKAAFSLIEVLIALVIIAILGAVVGLNLVNQPDEARIVSTRTQIQTIADGLKLYKSQQGSLPSSEQGLQALVSPSTVEPVPRNFPQGGYLSSREVPDDAWGNPFRYLIPGRNNEPFEVISFGADGEAGGEGADADLSSSDA